jgi:hypothetical protein
MREINHQNNVICQKLKSRVLFATAFVLSLAFFSNPVRAEDKPATEKEWTFLLFLNGHNNLDSFGAYNINQMEEVGSTDNLNMVVQWASLKNKKTQRLLVQKDNNTSKVTSPAVQTLPQVDMGDYKQLVEFVKWGVANYPAKHYFIAVWNHGNGWHRLNSGEITRDISYDDVSGHHITTEELGLAMNESAKIIGHKVDVYGSDACLMAMAEVAAEMKDSVDFFAGSEETEPGYGWPYNTFMTRWSERPMSTGAEVATALADEYIKAYDGGIYGSQDVTFSAFDLSKLDGIFAAVQDLKGSLVNLTAAELKTVKSAASSAQDFTYSDYKDLADFIEHLSATSLNINSAALSDVNSAMNDLVLFAKGTGSYEKTSHGLSIWLPTSASTLDQYANRYSNLQLNKATDWLSFLKAMNK